MVTRTNKDSIFSFLSNLSVDLVVSAGFPFILPSYVLTSGPSFINSHPSLLPNYKGYNSIKDAYKNGEDHMGVTVHYMTEELDGGDIIAQNKVSVRGMTLPEVYSLLFHTVEPETIAQSLKTLKLGGVLGCK